MRYLKENFGWILVIAVALAPVVIWAGLMPLGARFGSWGAVWASLGQLAGLVGMALFAENLILSARLKFFDRHLSGLNRVYINHHRIGVIAFVLLLLHPLSLALAALSVSLSAMLGLLAFGNNLALDLGKYSLLAMTILLVLTLFIRLRYDIWKNTHKFLGAAFFLGGLHAFMIGSDLATSPVLRSYMLGLAALGIVAYVYHTVLGRRLVRRYAYVVEEVKRLNDLVTEITLRPALPSGKMEYRPGQFAFLNFADWPAGAEQHPFSLTSDPNDQKLRFVIKDLGDYTARLKDLPKGATAKIEGPFGKFSFMEVPSRDQIWIAGGIGITPFLGMARALASRENFGGYRVDLYYSAKRESELVLLDELAAIAQAEPNFHLRPHLSERDGHLTARSVSKSVGSLDGKDILLCGPVAMMRSLKEQFVREGVKQSRLHSEEFSLR